ncbi:restriction endonuclease subunit S [Pediococcus pentosaceus]|uniref:restriction endonuclease subunit S n=1 Tax=Pediococcus pentosaceus TaxID=1255 RepID=UPI003F22F31F
MNDNQAKYPQLRFKGFTDPWEQRKLTEIVNRVNKSSNSDVLPKVEFEDIVSGEGRLNKDISSKFDSRKGTLFEPENILYGKLRPYLKNWLFPDFEGVALGDFWVFEATDVSVPSFDYYLIQSDDYQKVANDTSGTKMPRSDWKNVSSTDFAIPSKDEQKQIGAFFKQLDDTITLHQRKLAKLKELKQGYLQKMFPKNGAKVPELRFAGFADAWEQRKLGDYLSLPKKEKVEITNARDLMTLKLHLRGIEAGTGRETLSLGSTVYYKRSAGQFLYGKQNFFNGSMAIIPKKFDGKATSGDVPALDINGINSGYLYTYVSRHDYWKAKEGDASGTGSKRIHESTLLKFGIMVPVNNAEQQKIGSFFKQLDDTITLHQRKLEKLQELKKGYLQKMFC